MSPEQDRFSEFMPTVPSSMRDELLARAEQLARAKRRPQEAPEEVLIRRIRAAADGKPDPHDALRVHRWIQPRCNKARLARFEAIVRACAGSPLVGDSLGLYWLWWASVYIGVRPLEGWRRPEEGPIETLRSLVAHLHCDHDVPASLFSLMRMELVWEAPHNPVGMTSMQRADLFLHLAQGGSLRRAVAEGRLPVPLTRRQCHLWSEAPGHLSLVHGVRLAQVRSFGGSEELAGLVCGSELGRRFFSREEELFWQTVLMWLPAQRALQRHELGPLVHYLDFRHLQDPSFTMAGRRCANLLRDMEAWHVHLAQVRMPAPLVEEFTPSGLHHGEWTETSAAEGPEQWRLEEILTHTRLVEEGMRMRHCVADYARSIVCGDSSIWSLTRGGRQVLTVRVWHATKSIVEVRGPYNRFAREDEKRWVEAWAAANDLQVMEGAWGDAAGDWEGP